MNEFTVDDLKNRDEGALAAFHQYLAPKVRGLVARVLRERHEVEVDEVANEVFLRLFSRLDELTKLDDTRKVERYCLRAAHNIALEYLARFEKEDAIIESYETQLGTKTLPEIDKRIEEQESQQLIHSILEGLSPSERQILELSFQGTNTQEISNILDMDLYEIRYSLNKLRAKLRYRLMRMQETQ
jgi:RNA polymerase sigma factor (sigma-70 family)